MNAAHAYVSREIMKDLAHRLAFRYRDTPLGTALATVDKLHGVALRCGEET
jgi:hypothetical protein